MLLYLKGTKLNKIFDNSLYLTKLSNATPLGNPLGANALWWGPNPSQMLQGGVEGWVGLNAGSITAIAWLITLNVSLFHITVKPQYNTYM